MAVDPYVPTRQEDAPAPFGGHPGPHRGWRADRAPVGTSTPAAGSGAQRACFSARPGPDSGYGPERWPERFGDQITAVRPETVHDAEALARPSGDAPGGGLFGRGPGPGPTVELGFTLLRLGSGDPARRGWWSGGGSPPSGSVTNYARRMALVEAIPDGP